MNTGDLLAELTARRVILSITREGRLRVDAEAGTLTGEERAALAEHREVLLDLLRGDAVPSGPCELCTAPLAWVADWPTAGAGRWLCLRCAAAPSLTLAQVAATLAPDERHRLAAEAATGDRLAALVQAVLALRRSRE
jgi:hypothetical protein